MSKGERFIGFEDKTKWTFINGQWVDGPENALVIPESILRLDGDGIQGHHYAFLRPLAYGDLNASFEFRLYPHSDVGLIFRAKDPSHFHLLHFPNCGQASRAQHFWVALSSMDDSGYLRIVNMKMVPRVPSTDGLWLRANVDLVGDELKARIGDFGLFKTTIPVHPPSGRIGVYAFGRGSIRNLIIHGTGSRREAWDNRSRPNKNWVHPHPDTKYGRWQRPDKLLWTPDGDLLLQYDVQEHPYRGRITHLTSRSKDHGLSWSKPELLDIPTLEDWKGGATIHVFPDGVLRMMIKGEDSYNISEARDDGRAWSKPEAIDAPSPPPGIPRLHLGPQAFLNLDDGSVIMFAYGAHESTVPNSAIYTWGSHHCQAFSSRSRDNGKTWSEWVNVDGARDAEGKPVTGSMDLTEVCGAQMQDGRIMALIRPIYSPWMWETWSSDRGKTWSPCVRGPFPGYATPNMVRTESGAILVAHRLPGCTIHLSLDEGKTWDQGTMIDSAIWVMGSMLEVEPDVVLYIYWDSFESLMRAQFIRVTPKGLMPERRRLHGKD